MDKLKAWIKDNKGISFMIGLIVLLAVLNSAFPGLF